MHPYSIKCAYRLPLDPLIISIITHFMPICVRNNIIILFLLIIILLPALPCMNICLFFVCPGLAIDCITDV